MYTILSISDSDKHFASAIQEYIKRLAKKISLIDIKPVKHGTRTQIITKETEQLHKKIKKAKEKGTTIILLIKEGKTHTPEQYAEIIKHRDVMFIIGWPYGVDPTMLQWLIDYRISFGSHTMPHGLAKLVLIEQIYRVDMIQQGRSYHY